MSHCITCGAQLPPGARFCGGCGQPVAADPDATIPTPRTPPLSSTPSSAPALEAGVYAPGTMIAGRYRIVGLLGRGGMGEVYRADDLTLGQSVALKFLPEAVGHSVDRRERFLNEVRTAREVAHPNVCRVYDVGEVDERVFLSMEYIDGEDLSSLLRRIGRLPPEKALEIARGLCAGLGALHDRGVLHRDLKPANVMVDGRGRVRITDFGLSGIATEILGADARAGTPAYMAPEQLAGERADERSDVFSLGLTLYEVFTGQRAFDGKSAAEISQLHRSSSTPSASTILPDLDESVERVLSRCLDRDPGRRPPSAFAVAAALPGGDPLAAALAAGEVPSIEMVAAAGRKGGVRPLVGVAGVLAAVIGLVLYAGVGARRALHHWDSMEKPPAVLAERAREILESVGWDEEPADDMLGYLSDGRVLRWLAARDSVEGGWERLRDRRPAGLRFWYRTSPEHLLARDDDQSGSYDDPPQTVSGMARLQLDTRGRLVSLEVEPPQRDDPDSSGSVNVPPTPWPTLVAAAGLDPAALESASSEWVPASYADERVAWIGTLPEDPEVEIRVEGAAVRGRPVYFEVLGAWSRPSRAPDDRPGTGEFAFEVILILLIVAIFASVVTLAVRNVRSGRGDRSGAGRLSLAVLLAMLAIWVLAANHSSSPADEVNRFFDGLGDALLAAGLFWAAYLALEPFVRSTWPGRMVGWSRLLTGRWRDPLIGRDILVGAGFFLVTMLIGSGRFWILDATGGSPSRPTLSDGDVFLGVAQILAAFVRIGLNAVFNALFFFLVLLLARMLLRRTSFAIVAFVMLFAVVGWGTTSAEDRWVSALMLAITAGVWLTVLLRFGLLAFMVGFFFRQIAYTFPMTLDASAWYAGTSYFAAAAIIGLTLFGFRIALSAPPVPEAGTFDE